jgi:PadR family transcriptional regulator, regulatory protein AphA
MRPGGVENVILGALSLGPRTGYEIKRLVDNSTRFFWAASYGQIYPELKRLERAGFVSAANETRGGRRRIRYSLTAAGRDRLREWLRDPGAGYELRDEGLLKLFFAHELDLGEAVAVLSAFRAERQAVLKQLRAVEQLGIARGTGALVLDYGIASHEWMINWCKSAERRLACPKEVAR